MPSNWEKDSIFSLYHQMIIVVNLVLNYGLEDKPLSLFSNQEVSMFFRSGPQNEHKSTLSLSAWGITQNRSIRNARKRFLEKATDGAVTNIHVLPSGQLDKSDYEIWAKKVGFLAMHWNMQDKLADLSVSAMYKAGQDALGEEMMVAMTEKDEISRKLLRIAMLRLGKHITLSDKKIHLTPEIESSLKSFGDEVDDVASVDLNSTVNLLVALTNNDLGDSEQQSVYEWLAVAKLLVRNEL